MTASQFKELQVRRAMLLPFTRPQLTIQHNVYLPDNNPNWKNLQKVYDEEHPLGTVKACENPQLDMPPNSEYDARLINPATERFWTEEELAESDLVEPDPDPTNSDSDQVEQDNNDSDSEVAPDLDPDRSISKPKYHVGTSIPLSGPITRTDHHTIARNKSVLLLDEHRQTEPEPSLISKPIPEIKETSDSASLATKLQSVSDAELLEFVRIRRAARPNFKSSEKNQEHIISALEESARASRKAATPDTATDLISAARIVKPKATPLNNSDHQDRTPYRLITVELYGTAIHDLRSDYVDKAFYHINIPFPVPEAEQQLRLADLHDELASMLLDPRARNDRWKFTQQYDLKHDDFEFSYRKTHEMIYKNLKRIQRRLAVLAGLTPHRLGKNVEIEGQIYSLTQVWTLVLQQNEEADPYLKRTDEEIGELMVHYFPHLKGADLRIAKIRGDYNCGLLRYQKRIRPQIKSHRYTRSSSITSGQILVFRAWPNGRMKDNITPPYAPHQALRKNFKVNITLDPNRGHRTPLPRRTGDPNKARYTIIRKEQEQHAALGVYTPTEQSTFDPRLQSLEEEPLD